MLDGENSSRAAEASGPDSCQVLRRLIFSSSSSGDRAIPPRARKEAAVPGAGAAVARYLRVGPGNGIGSTLSLCNPEPGTESLRPGCRAADPHEGVEGKADAGELITEEFAEFKDGKMGLPMGLSFAPVNVADVGVVMFDARGWVNDARRP